MKTDTPLLPKLIEYNFNFYGRDITLYLKPLELMTGYILNSGVFYEVNNLVHIYNKFPKCGTIVDAGANQGNHATFFSRFIEFSRMLCFEPVPSTFRFLSMNVGGDPGVEIYNLALGKEDGFGEISFTDANDCGATQVRQTNSGSITFRTLDSFGLDDVSFIKIDTERMEDDVIRGASETIKRCKPVLYVESIGDSYTRAIQDALDETGVDYNVSCVMTDTLFEWSPVQ